MTTCMYRRSARQWQAEGQQRQAPWITRRLRSAARGPVETGGWLPACCCMPPVFLGPALRAFISKNSQGVSQTQTAAARAAAGADADARCRGRIGSGLA